MDDMFGIIVGMERNWFDRIEDDMFNGCYLLRWGMVEFNSVLR